MSTPHLSIMAFAVGVIAGMRSLSAPALVSHRLARRPGSRSLGGPLNVLAAPVAATLLKLGAVGELVVDKLPFTPNRIAAGPLAGRIASGALCGAIFYVEERQSSRVGAALGGAGALVGAYGFYWLRRWIGQATGAPDPLLGLAEDALVLGGAWLLNKHRID